VGIALPSLVSGGSSFYTNATAITAFLSTFNTTVTTLMTSPQLLMWTIGNEISLGSASGLLLASNSWTWAGTTFLGWANMWALVGTLAAIIHELDPYHPVASCTPNINADGARACARGCSGSARRCSCAPRSCAWSSVR
jgi:hypothetical protein